MFLFLVFPHWSPNFSWNYCLCKIYRDISRSGPKLSLLKKGDKLNPNNNRTIRLLLRVCKIMKSIIVESMTDFLLHENIIPQRQHGFVKGRSTLTNLVDCVNNWSITLNNNDFIDVIYLDFSKVLGKISMRKLLYKLDRVAFGVL